MNSIRAYLGSVTRTTRTVMLGLAVVFVSAGIAQAATTISTNISTAGTLAVTGLATLLGGATTTQITLLSGDTIKNASASSTVISGALQTTGGFTGTTGIFSSTLSVTGLATFLGGASTTQFTLLSGDTIKNASASSTEISGTLTTATSTMSGLTVTSSATLASTTVTSLKVSQIGTGVGRIIAGYCVTASITIPATNASSTQTFADCTPSAGTIIASNDRVFLHATSSLPYYITVQSASSTATGVINVGLTNFSTTTSPAAAIYAFNFWAFQ